MSTIPVKDQDKHIKQLNHKLTILSSLVEKAFFEGAYAGMDSRSPSEAWEKSSVKFHLDNVK